MATSRSFGGTLLTTRSPMRISPAEIFSRPAIMRSRVDLPHPDGPTSTTNSPSSIRTLTPWITSLAPKALRTSRIATEAMHSSRCRPCFSHLVRRTGASQADPPARPGGRHRMGLSYRFQFPARGKIVAEPAVIHGPPAPGARARNLPRACELSARSAIAMTPRSPRRRDRSSGRRNRSDPMQIRRGLFQRWGDRTASIDAELMLTAAVLGAALGVGLVTASDYGLSVDEFNTDDYGPKPLAWYTNGFADRSHFETVEFSLWYYGPWFQMLTAVFQSFDFADRITTRHAMTVLVGVAGIAALVPIGRIAVGRWAGLTALTLCLITGYLYGNLFFAPIDVPFLAAMTWATLAILIMTRRVLPSWRASIVTGLLTGLAIATRTGGIITHAYLLAAMALCV